jgi:hypothetical protein
MTLEINRHQTYYISNRERILESRRKRRRKFPVKVMLDAAENRARKLGVPFDLTEADITIPETCPILGECLVPLTRYAPSLDRIDNRKGYTRDNIQIISRKANAMKNDATNEELRKFASWVNKQNGT